MKLSIVIPVYNEENTVSALVRSVNLSLDKIQSEIMATEIIIVNDGSSDNTATQLEEIRLKYPSVKIVSLFPNQGKGAAVANGISHTNGHFVIIQDADLEYDPMDYPVILEPLLKRNVDVVFGSRFLGKNNYFVFSSYWANRFLTFLTNLCGKLNITDMETCYKAFRGDLIRNIKLESKRFGFEPEVTAKIAKIKNLRLEEVPISYRGRNYQEGKKIRWTDGIAAIWFIIKYNLLTDSKQSFKNSHE